MDKTEIGSPAVIAGLGPRSGSARDTGTSGGGGAATGHRNTSILLDKARVHQSHLVPSYYQPLFR